MKQRIINIVIKIGDFFLRKRIIKVDSSRPVKVNLGCGLSTLPEYYSLDGSPFVLLGSSITIFNKILYLLSGGISTHNSFEFFNNFLNNNNLFYCNFNQKKLPFVSDSVDAVYTSHFLEHVNGETGLEIIKEIYRILKPGCSLRIVLPCMDKAMLYYENKDYKQFNHFFYAANDDSFHSHKYAYNSTFLSKILKENGFSEVVVSSFKADDFEDAKLLDSRESESFYLTVKK